MKIKNKFFLFFALAFFIFSVSFSSAKAEVMEDFPVIKLQALDKSTARTVTFQAKVGSTIEYGSLYIKTQACRKSPPLAKPESAAFLQIWEVPIGKEKSEWIFSGWMFASSPALSAMDHPVYDVWVLDCLEGDEENKEAKESETKKQSADQADLEPVEGEAQPEAQEKVQEETQSESEINDAAQPENKQAPTSETLEEELIEDTPADDQEIQNLLDNVIEENEE